MADQPINAPYPNSSTSPNAPIQEHLDRAPAFSQTTHPSTTATGPSPEQEKAASNDAE